jgi:hypothetical protein
MVDDIPEDIQEAISKVSDWVQDKDGSYYYYAAATPPKGSEEEYEYGKPGRKDSPPRTSKIERTEAGDLKFDLYVGFAKFDDDEGIVAGIVYEPDVKDAQGDSASAEEIKKAAYDFMLNSMKIGLMHEKDVSDKVRIVECYLAPVPFEMGGQFVKKGSWVMVLKIQDEDIKRQVKDGELTGLSMSGTATDMAA